MSDTERLHGQDARKQDDQEGHALVDASSVAQSPSKTNGDTENDATAKSLPPAGLGGLNDDPTEHSLHAREHDTCANEGVIPPSRNSNTFEEAATEKSLHLPGKPIPGDPSSDLTEKSLALPGRGSRTTSAPHGRDDTEHS